MSKATKRERQRQNREAARLARMAAEKRRRRLKALRNALIVGALAAAVIFAINTFTGGGGKKTKVKEAGKPPAMKIDKASKYTATVETSEGTFEIGLDAKQAPQTVNSVVYLSRNGFYDGLTFHRVAKDFVVQGGDPNGDGSGGPDYTTPDEPPKDGYKAGSVAMANSGPGTSGSQFFVVLTDEGAKNLGGPPYNYSILGQVSKGFDVVQKLGTFFNPDQKPDDPSTQKTSKKLTITRITVTENGKVLKKNGPNPTTTIPTTTIPTTASSPSSSSAPIPSSAPTASTAATAPPTTTPSP